MLKDKNIHGFEFISSRELPELRGVLHEAVYKKNGAKLLFIDREDSNKTFAIAFKTIPSDSTGVFHILEHSVLCGSKKYPVKEPFVDLLKGSLKTFLNAFTFPDKTMYPVSSRNEKDFLNLVDVYMDAVLNPLAITKPEIFYQEGWHYELHGKEDDMIYKGVVFNEMKGAYSSADEVEMEEISSLLYRGSCYAHDSGGNPEVIPSLTYEDFVNAHSKYYHPSNARIILDGSVDLDKTLALLDSYLSAYERLDIDTEIPDVEKSLHEEKTVTYEIAPTEDPCGKTRVCLGFATAAFSERRLITALAIAVDAIAGSNDAPFKKAMLESGLCEDVNFISYDGIRENSILIEIKNIKEENIEKAKTLCRDTIRDIVEKGIDKSMLTASFNTLEFRMREQDMATFPAGIAYAISALDTWLYGGDPKAALSFEEDIAYLRSMLDTDYYEKLLSDVILNSKHSAALYMLPSPTLGEERAKAEKEKLAKIKAAMSDSELEAVIETTRRLEDWQKTEDSPEAIATLPKLSVSDICEMPEKYPACEYKIADCPALFTKADSRGITYTTLLFDISDFTEEELCLSSLLAELYKNVGTEQNDAVSLQTKIKTELGSFTTSILVSSKKKVVTPYFQVAISSLSSKLESAVLLAEEVLLYSEFCDKASIGKIIKQIKMASAESIAASGHSAAFSRACAYVSSESAVSEYVDGVENYLYVKKIDSEYETISDELLDKLSRTAKKIFTRKRLTVCHTGDRQDNYMEDIVSRFPVGEDFERGSKIMPFGKRKEGIVIPAGVSFSSMSGNVLNYEPYMHGSFGVVRSILSYGFLWNAIRVQGGAYGAGFIKRNNGTLGYYTYRDPDAKRSVEIFGQSPDFLRAFAESGESIETFIIGAVGDSDPLITPKVMSALSIASYLRGETYDDRVKRRKEMLGTSKENLLYAADMIKKSTEDGGVCVIGGKEKLDAFGKYFDNIMEI